MADDLWLEVLAGDGTTTVRVVGDVDLSTQARLGDALALLAKAPTDLVVNAQEMTFIDSVGLRLLHEVHRLCDAFGGRLTIRAPSPPVVQVLALSGLDTVLHVVNE